MSYILDALKKADAEREREGVAQDKMFLGERTPFRKS